MAGCAAAHRISTEHATRRPNLVYIFADQWRAQAAGYAGDPNAKTPNLDKLAKESINLTNAVSGCPVCSPYRASLMTGRYPLTHGVFLNDVLLSTDAVSIADAYNRAGYETGYIGKWHLDGNRRTAFIPRDRRQGFKFWKVLGCTHNYNNSFYSTFEINDPVELGLVDFSGRGTVMEGVMLEDEYPLVRATGGIILEADVSGSWVEILNETISLSSYIGEKTGNPYIPGGENAFEDYACDLSWSTSSTVWARKYRVTFAHSSEGGPWAPRIDELDGYGYTGVHAQEGIVLSNIALDDDTAAQAATEKLLADFTGHKDLPRAIQQIENAYLKDERYESARKLNKYIFENWPDYDSYVTLQKLLADGARLIADRHRYSGRHQKALELYKFIIENWPADENTIHVQKGIAISNIALADDPNAAAVTKKLIADFAGHKDLPRAVQQIADSYRDSRKFEKACRLYQYVVDNWPDSKHAIWAQRDVVISNIKLGDDDDAAAAVEKLLTNFSEHKQIVKAVNKVADHYGWSGKYEKARHLYQYVVDNWPDSQHAPWAQRDVAISNIKLGDDDDAAAAVEKLLTNFSEHKQIVKAVNKVADHYGWSGKYEKARHLYQYVVDNWPDSGTAIWSQRDVAISNIRLGNDAAAQAALDKLIADFNDHPSLPRAIFHVGEEYYNEACRDVKQGLDAKAKDHFTKAAAVWEIIITKLPPSAPYTARAYYFSAACYHRLGEYQKAIDYFQRAVDDWPDYQYAWSAQSLIGNCYEKLRNSGVIPESEANPKIEQAYEAVVEKYLDSPLAGHACLKLGQINFKKGQWVLAAQFFELFLQESRDGQRPNRVLHVLYDLGRAYEKMGEFEQAAEVYREFIKIADPDDPRVKRVEARLEQLKE